MRGHSLIEMLVVLALMSMFLLISTGPINGMQRQIDFDQFAEEVVQLLQTCRWKAMNAHSYAGAVVHYTNNLYSLSLYMDGNYNGIRLAEIQRGIDYSFRGSFPLNRASGDIQPAILNSTIPEIPPRTGFLEEADPIKFGRSNIISFSPKGDSSTGSLYLACRSQQQMYSIVLYGPTARIKVWKLSNGKWQMVGDR